MKEYANTLGWFTFADGFRTFLATYGGDGWIELLLTVEEHGEVVRFERA